MDALSEVLRWTQNVAFVAVGAVAIVAWRRRRDAQSLWLAVTFAWLAGIVALGLVTDALGEGTAVDLIRRVSVAAIAVFPYLLVRFLCSFEPLPRWVERGALALTALLVGWTVALGSLPAEGEPRSAAFNTFVLVFVAYWFGALAVVGQRFWMAGRGQPTLARRRLKLLSIGSVVLGSVLLLAGAAGSEPAAAATITTQVLGLISAVLFLVGFAPPRALRIAWRQPEEQRLHEASARLLEATTPEQVGAELAPHVAAVVGARAATIVHRGDVVGRAGPESDGEGSTGRSNGITVAMRNGTILVWTSRFTPFFGTEEFALLHRLAVLAGLALDRIELLAAERETRVQLERTNAELESFVYTASHDLKSPLIAMLGYLDVLQNEPRHTLDDEARWFVERMAANGRYMEQLIEDLLELSRVGRRQTEPAVVDTTSLVRGLAEDLSTRYPGASFVVEDLPPLFLHPARARQLLGNLLENACKYGGDEVTVRVTGVLHEGGGMELHVIDDGVGVPAEYAERVFGVFERLQGDDDNGGTGIGLAICRKIVETAGGTIGLAAAERGTDVRIDLPASAVARPADSTYQPSSL